MKYYSLNHTAPLVSFKEAVIQGLAPDKGLYFPTEILKLPDDFFQHIIELDMTAIAFEVMKPFVGDAIPEKNLKEIIQETLSFDFPVVSVEENIYALELYHGPTLAFKDVGARFMARCLGYFTSQQENPEPVTVLVATSGDTGGAVASGFYKVPGVDVVILYPEGKVSDIQERQLTTMGENITAIAVDGTFDDCQTMVKQAFLDGDFKGKRKLTSANSINVARWLPQMLYYFFAYKTLKHTKKEIAFSVPSGNFGNICAGMLAQQLGLPVHHFVTGTNMNNTVPLYLKTGEYTPEKSVATISNAMDVGAPSNFVRIQEIYKNDISVLRDHLSGFSYTDDETIIALSLLHTTSNYIADPHGAIGYLAVKEYLTQESNKNILGVFLETAHPVKFMDVIPEEIAKAIKIPDAIQDIMDKNKVILHMKSYKELKAFLLK